MSGFPVHLVDEGIDWPAWLQAVGSIAAILASAGLLWLERVMTRRDAIASRLTVRVSQGGADRIYRKNCWCLDFEFRPHDLSERLMAEVKVKSSRATLTWTRVQTSDADEANRSKTVTIDLVDQIDIATGGCVVSGQAYLLAEERHESFVPAKLRITIRREGDRRSICSRTWLASGPSRAR